MRLLAEALPPAGPAVSFALASLGALCLLIVAWGMLKMLDAIARAFFGTVEGAVGWIPFAGKVVKRGVHKIEQKISYFLGRAERKVDASIAWTWHNCAHLVAWVGLELEGAAKTAWHLAQQAKAFVRRREVTHEIGAAVKPVKAQAIGAARTGRLARNEAHSVAHSVAHGVYPRLKAGEVYDRTVVQPNVRTARAEARAAEDTAIATYKYLVHHRRSVIAGVFTGAVAWALTRIGGGWIRCKNWRTIGKHVCRWPYSLIEALLGLGLAFAVVIDPRKTAELAVTVEDAMESLIRKIAD